MKVKIVVGKDINDVKITNAETGEIIDDVYKAFITLEPNQIPKVVLELQLIESDILGEMMNKEIEELLKIKYEMTKDCIYNVSKAPDGYWENETMLIDLLKDYYEGEDNE